MYIALITVHVTVPQSLIVSIVTLIGLLNRMRSYLVIEGHQIQFCDIECLIRYEYKSGSHQTEIIDLYVSCLLYRCSCQQATCSTSTDLPSATLPQKLNKLLALPQQATHNRDNTDN